MKKAMISLPMAGRTPEEIVAARNKAIHVLEGMGYEVVNTMFTDEWYSPDAMKLRGVVNIPLCFLAKSLENMSKCHCAVMRIILFNQYVTIKTSHFRDCKYAD